MGELNNKSLTNLKKIQFSTRHKEESVAKLKAVKIKTDMSLWEQSFLDGSKLLDGSESLNVNRKYLIKAFISTFFKMFFTEKFSLTEIKKLSLKTFETAKANLSTKMEFDYCNSALTGRRNLRIYFIATVKEKRIDLQAEIIIKTRDYSFLDGSITLNGKRKLNSIYRKEQIQ